MCQALCYILLDTISFGTHNHSDLSLFTGVGGGREVTAEI